MKILITGAAGFIGFNLAKALVDKHQVVGIDNLNNYYSPALKKDRIKFLRNKNFTFVKADIKDSSVIDKLFIKHKFDCVINLAAQAGVLYSTKYPRLYLDSNTNGFFNLAEACAKHKVKKMLYASSSSVYGNVKKFPVKESTDLSPANYYGLTKKHNEEVAEIFSQFTQTKFIGLRFFTVFGPWGRPDMVVYKMIDSIVNRTKFYLNNNGEHYRDFTYVDDVVSVINKLISKPFRQKHEVFNVCSQRPVKLTRLLEILNKECLARPNMVKRGFQQGDVLKSHGSNRKLTDRIGAMRWKTMDEGLIECVNWFRSYYAK